ncbi:glutamate 5-kinase [Malaciobacter pacificus]|jgi:glutamate 5-kinase|uniref:Glutamate 5-kinase n=1 Tax=Malaciobacter pacificus TaxID=1080223 RepID=A0A5C2H9F0_9BACT|nr:glutamate 5-kinase [Malaciobacter pacificus]QEP34969.1 gamma-glutamyl kinase [Malaciobacter pacificus]GGD42614.1 glutamate 5-kinase [Malaciobacter pacificus]
MKRLVIKVGTAVLTEENKRLSLNRIQNLVDLIAKLKNEKEIEVILVSSGAVGAGYTKLQLDKKILANKQALAAIGQPLLLKHYKKMFQEHDIICAQMLFIADDFDSRKRSKNARNVMEILLENRVLPIINENDVIANEELVFGDNDQLAAHVAHYFKADMLAILTDIDGYYNKNPREHEDAELLSVVTHIEPEELEMKHTANSEFATGGIVTKLKAADFLMKKGIPMYLSSGFDLTNAYDFLCDENHNNGTLFKPTK